MHRGRFNETGKEYVYRRSWMGHQEPGPDGDQSTGMPDALSKTVPIWCAVINRALFPDLLDAHTLHTPPRVVGASEHAQIEERLAGFVRDFEVRLAFTSPLPPIRIHRAGFTMNNGNNRPSPSPSPTSAPTSPSPSAPSG